MTNSMDHTRLTADLAREAQDLQPWIVERRRHLHANPELSFQEANTAAFLRAELTKLGYSPSAPVAGKHGFYVDIISPKNPHQFVLLRADIDALPILEENDIPFKSQNPGVGHLCGHDTHASMLLGAASLLKPRIAQLPVSVRLVFQHAEEVNPGGAIDFVREGLTRDVLGCFGLHVSPRVPSGKIGLREGETMAAVGSLYGTVRGRGGHAAAPHETVDPMPAAAACVLALQQIVSRRIPPTEMAVVSVTQISGGTTTNVIPNEVTFKGTLRSFNVQRAHQIGEWIQHIVRDTAAAWGCEGSVVIDHGYPPVINDPKAVAASLEAIRLLFGETASLEIPKSMGAEDFSYFAQEKPGSFVFLGVLPEGGTFYPLHHPSFLPDETQLWRGAALLAAMPFIAPNHLTIS